MSDEKHQAIAVSTSPTIGAIAKALAAAQLEMGPAIKDRVGNIPGKDGKQGYRYTYATLATCFEAIQPLHKAGIAVTQIPLDGGNGGVLVATILMHESGEWIRGELWMPVTQQTPQGYGSALTYCRRYSLQLLCGLASEDDDGEEASTGPQQAPQRQPPRAPAKPPPNLGVFANLCDRVDGAESPADLNAIASSAQKAHRDGAISDSHIEQIKASVTRKRGLLEQTATNGGAA